VLGEPTGGCIPLPCCRAGCRPLADGVGYGVGGFEACDPRSDSKVVVQPVVDRVDLRFEVGSPADVSLRLRLFLSEAFELADRDAEFAVSGFTAAGSRWTSRRASAISVACLRR